MMEEHALSSLSKDELLSGKARELPWERVSLPMLGPDKFVYVQAPPAHEVNRFQASLQRRSGRRNLENIHARLAVLCLVDRPGGARVFRPHEADALGQMRPDALSLIADASQRVCGMSPEDLDEWGPSSATDAAGSASSSN